MPERLDAFTPMPGYGEPGAMFPEMLPPMGGGDMEKMQRQQEEAQRKEQTKAFKDQFIQQRGLAATDAMESARKLAEQSKSPLNIKVKTDPTGVSALGGALSIPISKRIGFTVGGGYATPQAQTQQIMNQDVNVRSGGQFTGQVGYRSPFMNVDIEHSPSRGFSGYANTRATW